MKSKFFGLFIFLLSVMKTSAQMTDESLTGEYDLEGVMEVGSGILLKADHTFEIFFSYGSLDKSGTGAWAAKDGKVILNSDARPANDFRLVSSKKTGTKGITIQISDPNKDILRYMDCIATGKGVSDTSEADQDGMIHFNRSDVDSLGLVHEMFSDRLCYFDISKSTDNYFEFSIERWIVNIYCSNLVLTAHNGYLEGPHPLLDPEKTYTFRKAE